MGLIQQARLVKTRPAESQDKKKSGLLDRVRMQSAYDTVLDSFRGFLKAAGYERGGILFPSPEGIPVLLFNTGFDLTTANRFSPDIATLAQEKTDCWSHLPVTSPDILPGCFSSREFDSLIALETCPFHVSGDTTAIIVLADSHLDINRTKKSLPSFQTELDAFIACVEANKQVLVSLSRISSINQTRDVVTDHAKSIVESGMKATLVKMSLEDMLSSNEDLPVETDKIALYTAIVHQIARQSGPANIVRTNAKFSVHIIIFSSFPVDTGLYFHQMLKPLEPLFGVQRISRIHIDMIGTSADPREIIEFAFRED